MDTVALLIGRNAGEDSFVGVSSFSESNEAKEGIDVFEINQGGKIQTMWGYWDPAAMLAQLKG